MKLHLNINGVPVSGFCNFLHPEVLYDIIGSIPVEIDISDELQTCGITAGKAVTELRSEALKEEAVKRFEESYPHWKGSIKSSFFDKTDVKIESIFQVSVRFPVQRRQAMPE